jgi:predicted DNA-binding transcriptional regulator YafY
MKGEPRRSASVRRHFLLVADLLRGRSHDRHSLAKRLGVRLAMADRLMKTAVECLPGVSEAREGRHRLIRLDRASLLPAPTYPTAVAACFGASLWPLFQGSSYKAGIRDALDDTIGRTRRRAVFKDIDRKFWFLRRGGEPALLDRAPLLDEAIEAVLHHRVIAIEYTRFGGHIEALRLEPLSIVVHDHQLYVIGRMRGGALHPYRFSRIASVDVLEQTFKYPTRAEYDPERVFRDSFGVFLGRPVENVVLRLEARWATYARTHRWHESQVVRVASGGIEVTLRVGVCPELEAWILGFGEQAEVIAPKELREHVRLRLASAKMIYEGRKSERTQRKE